MTVVKVDFAKPGRRTTRRPPKAGLPPDVACILEINEQIIAKVDLLIALLERRQVRPG